MSFLVPTMELFPESGGMYFFLTGFRLSDANGELIGPLFSGLMQEQIVAELQSFFKRPDIFWVSTGHSVYVFQNRFKVGFSEFDVKREGEVSRTISSMVPPPERIMEGMKAIARRLQLKLYFGLHGIHMLKNSSAYIAIGTMNPNHELALQVLPNKQNMVMVHAYSILEMQQQKLQQSVIPNEEFESEPEEEEEMEVVPTLEEVWAARDLRTIHC